MKLQNLFVCRGLSPILALLLFAVFLPATEISAGKFVTSDLESCYAAPADDAFPIAIQLHRPVPTAPPRPDGWHRRNDRFRPAAGQPVPSPRFRPERPAPFLLRC